MQAVDSKKQELNANQIVTIAAQNTKSPYSAQTVLGLFLKETQAPNTLMMRYGNTLYVIHPGREKKSVGTFRALNADTAQNFLESGYQFVNDAYEKGFDVLQTTFQDESILNIFRTISKNPPREGMGYAVRRTQGKGFTVTLKLGLARVGGQQ